ncbi:hypothetical protein HDV03_002317 [Kappamyces sp. JEL0829]|nr:hypothetical protein HDV03_002317 [Kappamyces sp. JEL0829]
MADSGRKKTKKYRVFPDQDAHHNDASETSRQTEERLPAKDVPLMDLEKGMKTLVEPLHLRPESMHAKLPITPPQRSLAMESASAEPAPGGDMWVIQDFDTRALLASADTPTELSQKKEAQAPSMSLFKGFFGGRLKPRPVPSSVAQAVPAGKPEAAAPAAEETRIQIENIEQEIEHYFPNVFVVRLTDRFVLLPTESDAAIFKEIKKFQKKNPAQTRSDVWDTFGMKKNTDAMMRIIYNEPLDFYMAYKIFEFFGKQNEKYRYQFIERMVQQGLFLVMDVADKSASSKKRDIFIVCPFERLLQEAQDVQLKMPLTEAEIALHVKDFELHKEPVDKRLLLVSATYELATMTKLKRSDYFQKDRIQDFVGGSEPLKKLQEDFFTSSQVGYLVQSIVNKIYITRDTIYTNLTEKKDQKQQNASDLLKTWYISDLLSKGLITRYCALHSRKIQLLKTKDAPILKFIKPHDVRAYFGEEIGLFFAWVQFYSEWCIITCIPAIIGTSWSLGFGSLTSATSLSAVLTTFDNSSTIFFALSLNLYSLLFLKFWKRRNHYLSFLWDVDPHSDDAQSERRSGWKPSSKLEYSRINGEMIPWESKRSRLARRTTAVFFIATCIIMLVLIIALNVGLLSYTTNNSKLGISFIDQYGSDAASAFTSAIAAIFIVVVGYAIDNFTLYLVDLENHRSLASHLNHFIWIQFIINFINSYGLMIFSAVFRPILYTINPNISYFFGPLSCLDQGSGDTCMSSLVLSIGVIFLVQQFLMQLMGWSTNIYTRRLHKLVEPSLLYPYQLDKKLKPVTIESFEKEYNGKIIQFGYIILFSAAFPFGPILAVFNNYFEVHLNLNQYIHQYNKPFVVRASSIGPWERIVTTLVYLGIMVNSILLPFISDGFYFTMQYLYSQGFFSSSYYGYHQIIFIILYEHFLFLCSVVIDACIADTPESVRVGRLSEKFISQQRAKQKASEAAKSGTGPRPPQDTAEF